jgi:Family of unknown function (DUF6519)
VKADLSRQTFDPEKHYTGVLMQQGRVMLDSEWNEQQQIHQHRAETGAGDVIGPSGTPIGEDGRAPGFEITPGDGTLYIGDGHIYVDGILCVNESEASYDGEPDEDGQPDPPNPEDLTGWMDSGDGGLKLGLVYLDVWERHVTHLDDGRIREVALGGPDTTTRKQTVWQVKVRGLAPGKDDAELLTRYAELRAKSKLTKTQSRELHEIAPRAAQILGGLCEEALDQLKKPPTGALSARTKEPTGTTGPCQIPPGGGYERLENQLYRVEVHRKGNLASARFKWSRDNGCVVTSIEKVNASTKEITVRDTGRDEFLSFANGQWVEIVDDHTELRGQYRTLLQIDKPVDHARRVITVRQTPPAIDLGLHPKLRRWDQNGAADETGLKLDTQELEDGIEVEFGSGEYRMGDYWLIPARTASGDIEWPREDPEDPNSDPAAQSPHGVRHSFCALAIVAAPQDDAEKAPFTVLHDCRNLFPPLTRLTSFFYLGGGGQEARPGKELPEPLRVGVANGQWPVQGARVRFEILGTGGGTLKTAVGSIPGENNGRILTVLTDADGGAACRWTLDEDATKGSQRVLATLLDTGNGTRHLPIQFSANPSVASEVAYDPGSCNNLKDAETTVQTAMDRLSHLSSLYYVSGDGQHVPPDEVDSLEPLQALVANDCGPVEKAKVSFKVETGNGTLQDDAVETNSQGIASCKWQLDPETPVQRASATLEDAAGNRTRGPTSFVFTATLNKSQARHVAYDPEGCELLVEAETVQEAIDQLCKRGDPATEPGFHVEEVRRMSDDAPVRNGDEMWTNQWFDGLRIVFDREVEPETINQFTCFVTLDMPWPVTEDERRFFAMPGGPPWKAEQLVGFQPLILRSDLRVEGKEIIWRPGRVEGRFFEVLMLWGNQGIHALPAHLTLKGNFIRAREEPDVYLDGDTFGDPRDEFGIRRPTGDGRRGGDFEMYVWLMTTFIG